MEVSKMENLKKNASRLYTNTEPDVFTALELNVSLWILKLQYISKSIYNSKKVHVYNNLGTCI